MKLMLKQLTITACALLYLSLPAFAGQLDDHYLAAFGEQTIIPTDNALQKAVLLPSPEISEIPHCGTPLKHDLKRDWNLLEASTQKSLAKQVAAPVLSGPKSTLDSQFGRFRIHYTTTGIDAVPSIGWVQTVAQTFENVATSYLARGWNLAPTTSGAPYDVYLLDLAALRLYGQTTSATPLPSAGYVNAYASYMEIDNDFLDSLYINSTGGPYTAEQSLQITATHEYHHAIQYGYNIFFDVWYAEATSTWHEDELYDTVNQLYNYIPNWFGNSSLSLDTATSTATGGGYGRWIFNRYLAEQHGTGFIKSSWDRLAVLNSPGNNADITMTPVLDSLLQSAPFNSTLGTDFFGFAKRVYLRNGWNRDINRIHSYVPVATVSSYPVSTSRLLSHYSFAYFKFTPSATVPTLSLAVNKTSGIRTALFKTVAGISTEITANSDGSYTVADFGTLNAASDEVVLLVVNTTAVDSHQVSFSTGGTPAPVTEPSAPVAATGGGGGGGCFIATAAYGSYLHPQVQVLRDFRDTWLLTNAPGRAFVDLYYRLSPPVADVIAQHSILKMLVRLLLSPIILIVSNFILFLLLIFSTLSVAIISRRRLHILHNGNQPL